MFCNGQGCFAASSLDQSSWYFFGIATPLLCYPKCLEIIDQITSKGRFALSARRQKLRRLKHSYDESARLLETQQLRSGDLLIPMWFMDPPYIGLNEFVKLTVTASHPLSLQIVGIPFSIPFRCFKTS